jgi:hypothetical protein
MSRNRIIYQTLGVYASQVPYDQQQTGVNSVKQLTRVQSLDVDFSRQLQDINQFGNLAAIDRLDAEAPTVNANLSYYLTDGGNESYLGLSVPNDGSSISCLSGILKKETDNKNLYLLVASEGSDAAGYAGAITGVVGVGNAFITSYSMEVAVGSIPTATVGFEALNYRTYADADGTNDVPAVNPVNGLSVTGVAFVLPQYKSNAYGTQPSALLPGDVVISLDGIVGSDMNDLKVQSATLSFDLSREPQRKLGSKFAFSREITFPVTASLAVEAELGEFVDGNLSALLCETGTYDLSLLMKKINCSGAGAGAISAQLKGAKLISQNISTSIQGNATLSAQFETQIGGPEDLVKGLFISGSYM